jgi:ribokinase
MNSTRKPIVVVGSINMDLVAHIHVIPVPGQTVIGTGFDTTPGGKGANQAVAVARLGYPGTHSHSVAMIGCVGSDVFGQALLDNLTQAGVGVSGVTRVSGPSGVAPILVDDKGQNSIVVVPGANGKVDIAAVDRHADLIRSAGMVLCQLELPLSTVDHTIALCAEAGVPVMLDPAPAAPLPDDVFTRIAWFTPNETEALLYTSPNASPETAASELIAKGLAGVVLKRGAEGAYVATAQGLTAWVKPFKVQVIDTVGAGDCFNGAFAVALLEGLDPIAAARFASAAAAISVTRRGAQASMPTRAEVDALLAEQTNQSS